MGMRGALPVAAIATLAIAGCGGDDDDSGGDSAGQQPTQTAESGSTGNVPSYEQVKRVALTAPHVENLCSSRVRDVDVSGTPAGETYKRLTCREAPILDYAVGKQVVAENYRFAVDELRRLPTPTPLWRGEDAYVKIDTSGNGVDEIARKIEQACDCGEVVRPSGR
jgi:hypothetical protein